MMQRAVYKIAVLSFAGGFAALAAQTAAASVLSKQLTSQGQRALMRGENEQAISLCEQALVADPSDSTSFACLADIYEKTGETKAAAKYFSIALSFVPNDRALLVRAAEADIRARLFEDAEEKMSRLGELCGDCGEIGDLRAMVEQEKEADLAEKEAALFSGENDAPASEE